MAYINSHGSKRKTRDSIGQILEGARFIYKVNDPVTQLQWLANFWLLLYRQDPSLKTGIFQAPLIQTIINKVWFKNKEDEGVVHPEFSENHMLPMATIAFVLTIVCFYFGFTLLFIYSFRSKITSTNGLLVNIQMSLSLQQPTRRNTVPTSNTSPILRRKHVRPTLFLVSSNTCSRLLGVSLINKCHQHCDT